ncbi:hypothetical protein LV716_14410 [Flagellimonas sp. HMM57]|uniref:hypothetical protein n=1 Tax=unclassified Flagellimonas TaxID=2644544 RepID=UPI001F0A1F3D|nr:MULTISPECIES: hypothetical protein [unclassified Flagellimonas]UII75442.1 hypothetical protein LV716_14410 [Flagellimonas sp. HMM57]
MRNTKKSTMIQEYIKNTTLALLLSGLFIACSNDDNTPDTMMMDDDDVEVIDFSGTFSQVDFMGRPGINTTLSFDMDGQPSVKDAHNVAIPSEMVASFQSGFEARLEQYHDVYANKLGLDPNIVNYENNILGLDATTLTTVLAADVLEVAPDLPTTYFNPGTDADNDGNILVPDGDEVALTGRTPSDDIIDVSLILFFGGAEGNRFSGQDLDDDGTPDLPRLTSDGVGLTADISTSFPYLGNPE